MRSCSRSTASRCRAWYSTRWWPATCSTPRARVTRWKIRRSSTSGYKALTEEDVCGRGAKAAALASLPVAATLNYAGERADLACSLQRSSSAELDTGRARRGLPELELPLLPVLVDMERTGIRVDGAALAAQSQRIEQRAAGCSARASSSSRATSSTSTRRSSWPRCCSRSCSCRSSSGPARPHGVDGRGGAGGAGADARPPAPRCSTGARCRS